MVHGIATTEAFLASRNGAGIGHDLRWGSLLVVTLVVLGIWLARTWRRAPDPEEQWRRAREEAGTRAGGTTPADVRDEKG